MPNLLNVAGKKFGRLTVIKRSLVAPNHAGQVKWDCLCDCGNTSTHTGRALNMGRVQSCGCYKSDTLRKLYSGPSSRLWKGCGVIPGTAWKRIVRHAAERGIAIAITIEDIWDVFEKQKGFCALSGELLHFPLPGKKNIGTGTASLDRIDSSKPYTKDNVQWVHKIINIMKKDLNQADFIKICKNIANHKHGE